MTTYRIVINGSKKDLKKFLDLLQSDDLQSMLLDFDIDEINWKKGVESISNGK